jgi:1-acyl-sn-glycerol-3-phosphate acyltransferase
MAHTASLERARTRGVSRVVYRVSRTILEPFFLTYFGMQRSGCEHVPDRGPVILAANHKSFLDPFVIGMCSRRPLYFVAKRELFAHRPIAWFLSSLGAFPIARGSSDGDAMATAREILARGEPVLIFPEGTRVRPGGLGTPRRGVGRLALETGAPVVPVAIIGTAAVRRGWRIRPHRVAVSVGPQLRVGRTPEPSPQLARAATDRIWAGVRQQWTALGGVPAPVAPVVETAPTHEVVQAA